MLFIGISKGFRFPLAKSYLKTVVASKSTSTKVVGKTALASSLLDGVTKAPASVSQHPAYDLINESDIAEYGCKALLYR